MTTTSQRAAIVTGAGSGIGRATAQRLSAAGIAVALVGRTAATLEETAAHCSGATHVIASDLTRDGAAEAVVRERCAQFGGVEILVNNAGQVRSEPLTAITPAALQQMLDANFIAPALLAIAALPHVSRVVNVTSAATADPFPGLGAYAAAKSALESITRSIMNEPGARPVHAFSVAPAAVETAMLRAIVSHDDLPTEAALTPDEVAEVIVACAMGQRDDDAGTIIRLAR